MYRFSADGEGDDEKEEDGDDDDNDDDVKVEEISVVPLTSSCSKAAAVGKVSGDVDANKDNEEEGADEEKAIGGEL